MKPHEWFQEEYFIWACKNCGEKFVTLASPFVKDGSLYVYGLSAFSTRVTETNIPINCNMALVKRLMEK